VANLVVEEFRSAAAELAPEVGVRVLEGNGALVLD
jgi:hypothetical protein